MRGGFLSPEDRADLIDETVDAASTIRLLQAIEAMYPLLAMIHVYLDDARYHCAGLVQERLNQARPPDQAAFYSRLLPASEPPGSHPAGERLWGVMHKHLTHYTKGHDE